ncbi:protein NEOXANTHIN-DEFICIENT 1-like [Zingiber officinale]|uniref:protein NEOXANTHIN-DEFICIENT 1-like n=1 Tax=Zingiber officinale TaxID=94328 RepID=UPI001C4DB9A9|nr:protein NEOXANTHIN-DEFICIENT 1-like [Zingiber officinale]
MITTTSTRFPVRTSHRDRRTLEEASNSQRSPFHPEAKEDKEIQVLELEDASQISICNISLLIAGEYGQTMYNPNLLKYTCQIECSKRESDPFATEDHVGRDRSIAVLLSKPVMALELNFLTMQVEAPKIVRAQSWKN